MPLRSRAFARQKLCLDFASLKHANLKGLYVAPVPEEPLLWTGVLFVRKGPYTNAILRFQISFPETYPDRAPTVTFQQDVFHPLVTPLTTYTHSTRERGGGTLSAADEEKLPPGGLVLSGAFPEWFGQRTGRDEEEVGQQDEGEAEREDTGTPPSPPHIASLLHFLRLAFTVPEILDEVPLALAANPSAWHAWRSHRAKVLGEQAFSPTKLGGASAGSASEGSGSGEGNTSPRAAAQPGGARRPGEWNWSGVWEDRIRKVVNASRAEGTLFGGEGGEVISFTKMDEEALASIIPQVEAQAQAAG